MRGVVTFVAMTQCMIACGFSVLAANPEPSGTQPDFSAFWNKFKSAVIAGDKATIAAMTNFPVSVYASKIDNRVKLLRRYNEVFNGEANTTQCFASAEPQKESARSYAVYCPFKRTPNDKENAPIRFVFELTKSGWRFAGLDNINE